ncbi:MAG: DUF3179 domain-containing (seleno)protein [Planctomycetota bacterium]|nr:DUF3179 domain-containing (seleno)protein [Planctomycetota bacterium]
MTTNYSGTALFSLEQRSSRRRELLLLSLFGSLLAFSQGFVPLQTVYHQWYFRKGTMDQRMNAEVLLIRQGPHSLPFLLKCLESEAHVTRAMALHAMGEIRDRSVVDSIIARLETDNEPRIVRQAAALALGRLGDLRAGPILMKTLDGDYPFLRFFAGLSLSRLTGQGYATNRPAWEKWWRAQPSLPPLPVDLRPEGSMFLFSTEELSNRHFYKGVFGTAQDNIPAITQPVWVKSGSKALFDRLADGDTRIYGIAGPGIPKSFIHKILSYHQVVNFTLEGRDCVLFSCPLGEFAAAYYADLDGAKYSFGVSGFLRNGSLVPYDKQTESFWNPLDGTCTAGPRKGKQLERIPVVQCTWRAWLKRYPTTDTLSPDSYRTGIYSSRYLMPLYPGEYERDRHFSPLDHEDKENRLPPKELVLGFKQDGLSRVYPVSALAGAGGVIQDKLDGQEVLVQWDAPNRLLIARSAKGKLLPLVPTYWFVWHAYFPETEIWEGAKVASPHPPSIIPEQRQSPF